jgi:hypothetical protein
MERYGISRPAGAPRPALARRLVPHTPYNDDVIFTKLIFFAFRCLHLDPSRREYITKLAFKVERQALAEADRTKTEERMNFTRENYRLMRERLMRIVW